MAYKGKEYIAPCSQQQAYDKLSDMRKLAEKIDNIPADLKEKMGDLRVTEDTLTIGTPQVGDITLKRTEAIAPSRITFSAIGSPVPVSMSIVIDSADSADECKVGSVIDIDIPMMLRPMIGGKMQEAADKFSEMLIQILSA